MYTKSGPRRSSNSARARVTISGSRNSVRAVRAMVLAATSIPLWPMVVPPAATACQEWDEVPGTTIGHKGMLVAAKTIALTARTLFLEPEIMTRARAEFDDRRGPNFVYTPLLGDRDPPLDYRASVVGGGN